MHRGAGSVLIAAAQGLNGTASLRTLLLGEAHVLRLHHVRGHAQRLLMPSMRATSGADRLHLGLLHGHHVQGLLRRYRIQNIVIGRILPTHVRIVIAQRVQNFAECFVQARIRLIQTISLRVMCHRVVAQWLLLTVAMGLHVVALRIMNHLVTMMI